MSQTDGITCFRCGGSGFDGGSMCIPCLGSGECPPLSPELPVPGDNEILEADARPNNKSNGFEASRQNATIINGNRRSRRGRNFDENLAFTNDADHFKSALGIRLPKGEITEKEYIESLEELSLSCQHTIGAYNQAGMHMNTAVVATDMLSIAKAVARGKGQPQGDVLVNYFGISYGTILGQWFASLYPSHVGRFVLQSAVDPKGYRSGDFLTPGLTHADESWFKFFEFWASTGPENCMFANNGSAETLVHRFNNISAKLDVIKYTRQGHPATKKVSKILSKLKATIFQSLYSPRLLWPDLAKALASIEPLLAPADPLTWNITALLGAISPSDSQADVTAEEKAKRESVSIFYNNAEGATPHHCKRWRVRPAWEWDGEIGGHTANPMSFVGNEFDPITPAERYLYLDERFTVPG
ncbi:hypothetical protein H072_8384 [Dactylellina haptotyla CBS 200.50]|uniref:AB hydrolase-1 domain-containing protein n=1 Tax=Dactylellina haptotyla (strain CBS 200.50) TaxID=1284197 RepID=S8BFA7_DACHA|nr:hypothetical protein H072_8384 [Dactylellina haptotyla CBS 200.50]